jgi:hypothetical protein
MKRTHFSCLALVLLTAGTLTADLTVYEYVLSQPVTPDTNTGKHWYWNLEHFVRKTYDEQISAIAGLRNRGNTAGGWHMAAYADMQALWTCLFDSIMAPFGPSLLDSSYTSHLGRCDHPTAPSTSQYLASAYITLSPEGPLGSARLASTVQSIPRIQANHAIGTWGTGTGNDWSFVVFSGHNPAPPQKSRTKPYGVTLGTQAADGPWLPTSDVVPNARRTPPLTKTQ